MTSFTTPLIAVEQLSQRLNHDKLVILDASYFMPVANRDGQQEWQQQRIAQAQYFDFDRVVCAPDMEYPHMMPSPERFTEAVQALGVNQDSEIVIYDTLGLFASPRAWWMFRAMGHEQVSILDGGMPAWQAAGLALNQEAPRARPLGNFVARYHEQMISDAETVLSALQDPNCCVLDARSEARFEGLEAEPREGLRRGHMPGAKNLPFLSLIDNGRLKPKAELQVALSALANKEQQLYLSCGSGVTACHLALAAHVCGYPRLSVYDGSWSEWGAREELPITMGKARR